MAIIIKKNIKDVHMQQAVNFFSDLPKTNNHLLDTRYVKVENTFYIFNGSLWVEVDLVIG